MPVTTPEYRIASRFPTEVEGLPEALISPQMRQQLLIALQDLLYFECQVLIAQQLLSQFDLFALNLAYQTSVSAAHLQEMYGVSQDPDGFYRQWQQDYLQAMNELMAQARDQIVSYLKGEE